jgi:hypothetical protein
VSRPGDGAPPGGDPAWKEAGPPDAGLAKAGLGPVAGGRDDKVGAREHWELGGAGPSPTKGVQRRESSMSA